MVKRPMCVAWREPSRRPRSRPCPSAAGEPTQLVPIASKQRVGRQTTSGPAPARQNDGPVSPVWWLRRVLRWSLAGATWGLLAAALVQWILIRWLGDVWWVGTVALFAPRWPLLIPIAWVAALCLIWQRRLFWINFISGLIVAGPVMGFCLPSPFGQAAANDFRLRILTANNGDGATIERLRAVIQAERPDVMAFEEYGPLPPEQLVGAGWHWKLAYGPVIFSRYPIIQSESLSGHGLGRYGTVAMRVLLDTPAGKIWVCCQHLNTPREGFEDLAITRHGITGVDTINQITSQRDFESKAVRQWVQQLSGPTVIVGDFNMPVESRLYRRDWSAYQNAFSTAGWGYGHTKFTHWHGVRIDHILADDNWRITDCHVAAPTGGDHRPLVADLALRKQ
jgi:vancomycin resistance protein VanJ